MTDEIKLYTPRLKAYEFPELFEPVDLGLSDTDEDEPKELGSFVLPVCIEAVPLFESNVIFLVKEKNEKIVFQPKRTDAIQFKTVECASQYIQTVLKPRYGDKWSFVLWSYSALQ